MNEQEKEILKQMKTELKDEFFSEGIFKVIVNEKTIIETPSILTTSGSVIPLDWEVVEDAIYGFDTVENCKRVFEDDKGQHFCFFGDETSILNAVVPGVQLMKSMEDLVEEFFDNDDQNNNEELNEIGITKESWNKYLEARPEKKSVKNKM